MSHPDFRDLKTQNRVFSSVVFARGEGVRVRGDQGAEDLLVAYVSEGLFPMMGTPPTLGRAFAPDEESAGAERTIVLGHAVWMERFGGDRGILNTQITTLDGPYTVIGIMPPSFTWPEWAQAWSPLAVAPFPPGSLERRAFRVDARAIGRVAPGVAFSRVATDVKAIGDRLAAEYPAENGEFTMRGVALHEEIVGALRQPLFVLLGAVIGLLLIACANVGNLSLARASVRAREIGVRMAIGASRGRIVRQMLVESVLLAALGAALGTMLAYGAVETLVRLAPADLPRLAEVAIDGRVLLFALGVCALSALTFGLAPALSISSANLVQAVKDGGRGASASRRGTRLRATFVVAEIAMACALVMGSGLLVKSFANMRGAHPGFDPERLISLRIEPLESRYKAPAERLLLYNGIRDAVARIPGVERVSYINHSPATRSGVFSPLESDGEPRPGGRAPGAAYRLVDSDYFETMGQRVVRGRGFTAADMTPTSRDVVVNETLARSLWGSTNPLGRRIVVYKQLSGAEFEARVDGRVVGVVEDIKDYDISSESWPEVFLPFPVNPWRSMYLAIKTKADPHPIIPAVQRVVRSIDRDLPVRRTAAVDQMLGDRLARRRFNAAMVTTFGIVALLIAAFGIYGIVAYAVTQRTQEIGVRAALGAQPATLVRLFVGRGVGLAALGALLGVALSVLLARAIQGMLFGVGPNDITTLAQVTVTIIVIAGVAAYFPARRALHVDPLIAMRGD
jgi:putative ABC transport system permease protein